MFIRSFQALFLVLASVEAALRCILIFPAYIQNKEAPLYGYIVPRAYKIKMKTYNVKGCSVEYVGDV